MNPKIFVGAAVGVLVVILGGILLMGPSITIDQPSQPQSIPQASPLRVELGDIIIQSVSERTATIEISFKVINPNQRSIIVQVMDYQLFETGYSETEQISGGQIGSRPGGLVEFGSNYYTLLGDNSIVLRDKIILKNSGNTPQLWSALQSNTASWQVSGDIFYNLSSMTSGQENELHFEFTK